MSGLPTDLWTQVALERDLGDAERNLLGEVRRLARVLADPSMGKPALELLSSVLSAAAALPRCGEEDCRLCDIARRAATIVIELMKARGPVAVAARPIPKMSGDPCGKCGMFAMVWTGTCRTCGSCGESSGGC